MKGKYDSPLRSSRNVVSDLQSRIIRHKRNVTYSGQFPSQEESKKIAVGAIEERWTKFEINMYKDSTELKKDQLQAVRSMS